MKFKLKAKEITSIALFTALIVVGAYITVPIPPVPFTLQFLFTMLAGLILGARKGAISVAVYVVLGVIGLPVFSGGRGGYASVLMPSFGYIVGFLIGAFVTGLMANSSRRPKFSLLLIANITGLAIVYVLGASYFYLITRFYLGQAIDVGKMLISCVVIFIPKDVFLCVIAAFVAKKLIPIYRSFIGNGGAVGD